MLEQQIASIAQFLRPLGLRQYFGEVPQGIETPSIYFPAPEAVGNEFSLSTYENHFSLFIKVFDRDSLSSYTIASKILKMVQAKKKKIPLYAVDGTPTGKHFWINEIEARNIDDGTTQIMMTWKVHTFYDEVHGPIIEHIHFDGIPSSENEEVEK